jgi:hypothetical protein
LALSPPCGFGKLCAMKKETVKRRLKREIAAVLRSMDFVSEHPVLARGGRGREAVLYSGIYQQLALAWEHLALQCRHWDGFKKKRGGTRCCPICGLVEGMEEPWLLLPRRGTKSIGQRTRPTSVATFASKKAASVLDDAIVFHGAKLQVAVANPYRSNLFRDLPITVAAHRTVTLFEDGFECGIDEHMVRLRIGTRRPKAAPPFGASLSELPRRVLKAFPVMVEYDRQGRLVGLCLFRAPGKKKESAAIRKQTGRKAKA